MLAHPLHMRYIVYRRPANRIKSRLYVCNIKEILYLLCRLQEIDSFLFCYFLVLHTLMYSYICTYICFFFIIASHICDKAKLFQDTYTIFEWLYIGSYIGVNSVMHIYIHMCRLNSVEL